MQAQEAFLEHKRAAQKASSALPGVGCYRSMIYGPVPLMPFKH